MIADPQEDKFQYLRRADGNIRRGDFPAERFPEYRRVVSLDLIRICVVRIAESPRAPGSRYLIYLARRQRAIFLKTPGTYCCPAILQQLQELEVITAK